MSTMNKKQTPPFTARTQKIPALSIGRIQNLCGRREDHMLSISPWYNQDTNLNGRESRNSSRGVSIKKQTPICSQKRRENLEQNRQHFQSKKRSNTVGLKPCYATTDRSHTDNIYIDEKNYVQLGGKYEDGHHNQEEITSNSNRKRITLKMKTLEVVENVNLSNAAASAKSQASFLPNSNHLHKYQSEQITERKMSLNRFRSPSPIANADKNKRKSSRGFQNCYTQPTGNYQNEPKYLQRSRKRNKKLQAHNSGSLLKKSVNSQQKLMMKNKYNYYDFQQTKVLIQKKLASQAAIFEANLKNLQNIPTLDAAIPVWEHSKMKKPVEEKVKKILATTRQQIPTGRSLIFFLQPRQKNNIMSRERNIMKLRNLVNNSRNGKRTKTDIEMPEF